MEDGEVTPSKELRFTVRVTGERAWVFNRGVTQIRDNMSLRGSSPKNTM